MREFFYACCGTVVNSRPLNVADVTQSTFAGHSVLCPYNSEGRHTDEICAQVASEQRFPKKEIAGRRRYGDASRLMKEKDANGEIGGPRRLRFRRGLRVGARELVEARLRYPARRCLG